VKEFCVRIDVSPRRIRRAVMLAALLNLTFMAGSAAFVSVWPERTTFSPLVQSLLRYVGAQVHLGVENVVATWYSSMLLLTGGVLAALSVAADRRIAATWHDRALAWGWAGFASVFVILSADEIASLHERIGMIEKLNLFGNAPPGLLLGLGMPITVVAACLIAFAVTRGRRSPLAARLVILGIVLLMTVPLQEELEMMLKHAGMKGRSPYLFLLEEGVAELFGALCLAAGVAVYLGRASELAGTPRRLSIQVSPRTLAFMSMAAIASMAALFWAFRVVGVARLPGDTGTPENWFPAATAWLAAAVALQTRASIHRDRRRERRLYAAIAFVALVLSAYSGAALFFYRTWGSFDHLRRAFEGGLLACAAMVAFGLRFHSRRGWPRWASIGWVVPLAWAVTRTADTSVLVFTATAVLFLVLVDHLGLWAWVAQVSTPTIRATVPALSWPPPAERTPSPLRRPARAEG
jgi:hypothetical protein